MAEKLTLDQYEICINFKTDNIMSISVQFLPTGEYFQCEDVQLMRIKKDTVMATLQKKAEKNLRCEFDQFVDKDSKYLIIKFFVNFDFLPQFSEEIKLGLMERNESISTIQINNFKVDMDILESTIQSIQKNGLIRLQELSSNGNNQIDKLTEIKSFTIPKGKYLLRLVGLISTPSSPQASRQTLTFVITADELKIQKQLAMYIVTSYSYPFSFEQPISINAREGEVKIEARCKCINWTLTNMNYTLYPIPDFK